MAQISENLTREQDVDPAVRGKAYPFPIPSILERIRRVRLWWLLLWNPRLKIDRSSFVKFGNVRFNTSWGEIVIGKKCHIYGGNLEAYLTVGDRVNIIGGLKIGGSGKYRVIIGDDTWIAPNVYICPNTHQYKKRGLTITAQGIHGHDIVIGSDCWIGVNVVISPGVSIGNGAVIGANAVVTKDIPDYAVAVGVPARIIGYRE
ncbi:MAG TPA: acyltransferase [Armatimonadota bacterium]|nr:acyltransferase [Armatimonadota bacterium]